MAPVDSLRVTAPVSRRGLLGLGLRHLTAAGDAAPGDEPPSPSERGPAVQARWNAAWDACGDMGLWEEAAATLVRCAACESGERVLDAGAGDGNVALLCARRGAQVTACEPAATLLERGRARADRDGQTVEWVEGALEALPFGDATFDRVLAGLAAVFCLQPPATTLAELFRVVRPGGIVAFSTWRSVGLVGGLLRLARGWDPLPGDVPGPLAWSSEERLRQEVEPFGGEEAQFHLAALEMRFAGEDDAARRLLCAFAPLTAAHDALPAGAAEELCAQVAALVAQWAEPAPQGVVLRARYIVALARRPAADAANAAAAE